MGGGVTMSHSKTLFRIRWGEQTTQIRSRSGNGIFSHLQVRACIAGPAPTPPTATCDSRPLHGYGSFSNHLLAHVEPKSVTIPFYNHWYLYHDSALVENLGYPRSEKVIAVVRWRKFHSLTQLKAGVGEPGPDLDLNLSNVMARHRN
jgi:hypothetical protein